MLSNKRIEELVRQLAEQCDGECIAETAIRIAVAESDKEWQWQLKNPRSLAYMMKAAHVRNAIAEEREACCKALCFLCANGLPVQFVAEEIDMPWLGWWHPDASNEAGPACRAAVIRRSREE